MSDIEVTEIKDGDWKEVVNKEEEVLQLMRDYVKAKISDINQQVTWLHKQRECLYDQEMYIYDLLKARGYDG